MPTGAPRRKLSWWEEAHLEAIGTTFDIYDTDGGGELDVKGEIYEQTN